MYTSRKLFEIESEEGGTKERAVWPVVAMDKKSAKEIFRYFADPETRILGIKHVGAVMMSD